MLAETHKARKRNRRFCWLFACNEKFIRKDLIHTEKMNPGGEDISVNVG